METSVIEHPALPESANILATAGYVISPQNLGVAATERNKLRERELTRLELRGEIKPATVLNRSPFPLECVNSPWDYIVPARQSGKPYGIKIVASTRTVFRFTGNREMSDHSVRGHHEPKIILPIEQAMEFSFFYNGLSSEDFYSKPGGVIVFEGTMEGITPTFQGHGAMHWPPVPSPPNRRMRTPSPCASTSTRSSLCTAFGSSPPVGSHTEKSTTLSSASVSCWRPK